MNRIKKINLKVAGYLNIVIIGLVITVHFLVIFGVIPFTWVNGGRSETLAIAQQTSIISVVILEIMILINLWACGVFTLKKFVPILRVVLWILFAYFIFSLIQQLIGTTFEKFVMSLLCAINVILYFRLAIEKR